MFVFGSAVTLFFWSKWLGKLCAVVAGRDDHESIGIPGEEKFVLSLLAFLTVAVCLFFPVLSSSSVVVPYLETAFQGADLALIANQQFDHYGNPCCGSRVDGCVLLWQNQKRIVPIYLSGENVGIISHSATL